MKKQTEQGPLSLSLSLSLSNTHSTTRHFHSLEFPLNRRHSTAPFPGFRTAEVLNEDVIKRIMESERKMIYHEKQRLQFCLLHALNNLFQDKDAFTRVKLNAISRKLDLEDPNKTTWTPLSVIFKPHHNTLSGNYDVNVLIAALEGRGKTVIWHDRRNGASLIDLEGPEDELFGIILNVPVTRYGGLWRNRHWIALRRIESVWYNLDSDFSAPFRFESTEEIREFLEGVILNGGEVLLVKNGKE